MTLTKNSTVAHPDLANLPKSSLLRLYLPEVQGNSFSLDGFPALTPGKDWLSRLTEIIELQGAVGMTTNQTIFRQLVETGALDEGLRALKAAGRSAEEIYRVLYNEAATQAAQAFGQIHARWPWEGRVSQEASAFLSELEPLVADVRRIAGAMQGVGAFTKIPNLAIGPRAIEQAVAGDSPHSGPVPVVHPNVTLVFSDRHYLDTVEGYLLGLERRGRDLGRIHSVNSLFVSRVDRVADPMIEEAQRPAQGERNLSLLQGKVAVAQGKKIYQIFEAIFLGVPFKDPEGLYADEEGRSMLEKIRQLSALFDRLKALGAHPQRLLIASSGVKSDQPYSPLLYVLPFLGPWCANTMPEGTLAAFSRFVERLSDEEAAALKERNLMREPLPAIPTEITPTQPGGMKTPTQGEALNEWDRALLMSGPERKAAGIKDLTVDAVLRQAQESVFRPRGTSLRAICDTLRDKGAASFLADEEATLKALQAKLATL